MKFFTKSEGGTPRPDLKKFDDIDDEHKIPQEQKINRTQPNKEPSAPAIATDSKTSNNATLSYDKRGMSFSALSKAPQASAGPANKSQAVLTLNSKDWVFTQATGVASVPTEEDGYTIKVCGNELVNNNGNAFTNKLMGKMYKTFIGAHNYVDHIQELNESRGVLLDAIPRKIILDERTGDYGIYVDTLIATNKNRDRKWADMITKGEIRYLSMGCESSCIQCSKCGHIMLNEDDYCECLAFNIGMHYIDGEGNKRRIAGLVSDEVNEDGEQFSHFIELSYLSVDPAFSGAIQGHVIDIPDNTDLKVTVPRVMTKREAFQYWASDIKGLEVTKE